MYPSAKISGPERWIHIFILNVIRVNVLDRKKEMNGNN